MQKLMMIVVLTLTVPLVVGCSSNGVMSDAEWAAEAITLLAPQSETGISDTDWFVRAERLEAMEPPVDVLCYDEDFRVVRTVRNLDPQYADEHFCDPSVCGAAARSCLDRGE